MRLKLGLWTGLFAIVGMIGCSKQQIVVSFVAEGIHADSIYLMMANQKVSVKYDTVRVVQLVLEHGEAGYAQLVFGQNRKLLYLEPGKELKVSYTRIQGGRKLSYGFEGDLVAENSWLDTYSRMPSIDFKHAPTSADAVAVILDSIRVRMQRVEAQGFNPAFCILENKRETVATLRSCRAYSRWDEKLYPLLREYVQCMPELFLCDEYRKFVIESLGALAFEKYPDMQAYEHFAFQLEYIAQNIRTSALQSYFAAEVATSCMGLTGARYITQLMETARPLVVEDADKKQMEEDYRKWVRVAPGSLVDDYVFKDLNDKEIRLSDFRGKYIFIDCWATWCGPCRRQVEPLRKLEEKYAGRNIVFMGVSSDADRAEWKEFVKKHDLPGLHVNIPADSPFYAHFAVSGIPRFIVLAPDGTVCDAMFPRPSDLKCMEMLDKLLN